MPREPACERNRSTQPGKPKAAASRNSGSAESLPASTAIARIHAAIRAIPTGKVAGYGVVARRAGLPGRARLVARILSNNEDPTLPWHRVLRSDGRIAFPVDSEGYAEQTQRLRAEGLTVENGRVRDLIRAEADLDAALWAPPKRRARVR